MLGGDAGSHARQRHKFVHAACKLMHTCDGSLKKFLESLSDSDLQSGRSLQQLSAHTLRQLFNFNEEERSRTLQPHAAQLLEQDHEALFYPTCR